MRTILHRLRRWGRVCLIVATACTATITEAATYQWNGSSSSDWTVSGNWVGTGTYNGQSITVGPAPTGGTFAHRVNINNGAGNEAIYSATQGTTVYANSSLRGLVIGSGTLNAGTLRITGGSLSTVGSSGGDIIGNGAGNSGTLIIDGGQYLASATVGMGIGGGPTSTFTINSGSATLPTLSLNNTTGILNLNGGTLTVNTVTVTAGNNTFNFSGGTYKAGAATAGFSGLNAANVKNGGATFDSNGFAISIAQPLLHFAGATTDSLTKSGTGTLTLSGANTYSGGTTVSAGTLTLSGSGTLGATTGSLTFSGNSTALDVGSTAQTVASVTAGTTAANYNVSLAGSGTLSVSGNLVYQGNSANSGAYGSNPTLTINPNVAVSGSTLIGRANFTISGGTFTTARFTANPDSADWANLTISGGTVTATNGIDGTYGTTGANGTSATFALNLNGGTLYTPSMKLADRELGVGNNDAYLTFNGTTVKATADTSAFITLYGGNQNAYLSTGGAILDTYDGAAARSITIGVILKDLKDRTGSTTGGLTKSGSGTLTLSGANTYSGATTVNQGRLVISANQTGTGNVIINNTGTIKMSGGKAFASGINVAVNAGGSWLLDGSSQTVGQLTGAGSIDSVWSHTGTDTLTVGAGDVSCQFDGTIAGGNGTTVQAIALTKTGAGTLTLPGVNTFSGAVTINAGRLVAGDTAALGSAGKIINVNPSGTLELATDTAVNTYALNSGSGGTGTILMNRATSGAALTQSFGGSTLGNSEWSFQAGANVTSGTPAANFSGVSLSAGVAGLGYAKINPTGVNVTIGTLTRGGVSASALRLGGTSTGNIITGGVSDGSASYTINKVDGGTWELAGVNTYTGSTTVENGTLVLSGNRVATAGAIDVGNTAGQTGTLNIQGDLPMGANALSVGLTASGAAGIVNQTAGTVSFSGAGNAVLIGRTTGGVSGTYNLSGGTLTPVSGSSDRGVMIGVNAGTAGNLINAIFNLSGTGYLNNLSGTLQVVRGDSTSSYQNSTYSQSGGTSSNGTLLIGGNAANGANSIATFTVTGGTFTAATFSNLSRGNSVVSTLTIGGTADVTLPAFPTARGTSSTATLYFDGGTLRPSAASAAYISGLTAAYIKSGGVRFNTSGFGITVSQTLLTDAVSLGGGLTKEGAGTLTLSGGNTYSGASVVSTGILVVANATALGTTASGTVVSNGARVELQGNITVSGEALTISGTGPSGFFTGSLNSSSGANTWAGNVTIGSTGTRIGAESGATLTVSGVIDSGGNNYGLTVRPADYSTAVVLSGANTYVGDTTVLNGILRLDGGNDRLPVGTKLITGASTVSGFFDLNGYNQEVAALEKQGTGGINAVTNTSLTASTFTVNAATPSTYAGTIGVNLALVKSGADTLTLSATNTYSGGTMINAGTLSFVDSALGSSGNVTMNGGTLQWASGNTQDLSSRLVMVSGKTATFDTLGNNVTLGTAFGSSSSGALAKLGSGTLTLVSVNTFTGSTTVGDGTLSIATDARLGTAPGAATAGMIVLSGGGKLSVTTSGTTLSTNRGMTLNGAGGTLEATGANNLVYRGVIAGTGALTLSMAGGGNEGQFGAATSTYSGGTVIAAGSKFVMFDSSTGSASSGNLTAGDFGTGTITINNVSLRPTTAGARTIGNAVTLQGNLTVHAPGSGTSPSLTFSGPFTIAGATRTVANNANDSGALLILSGNIGDGGGGLGLTFTSTANRTFVLSGTNTYTGPTLVTAGTLQIGNNGTTGSLSPSSVLTVNSALVFHRSDNMTQGTDLSSVIVGSGTVTKNGAGTVVLSGANGYTGTTAINEGQLVVAHNTALGGTGAGTTVAGGAEVALQGGVTVGENFTSFGANPTASTLYNLDGTNVLTGNIVKAGPARLVATAGRLVMQGSISGSDNSLTLDGAGEGEISGTIAGPGSYTGLTKTGAGTWTLSGNNTYSRLTNVSQGQLTVAHDNALGSTGVGTTVASGATLAFTGGVTVGETITNAANGIIANLGGNNVLAGSIVKTGVTTLRSDAGLMTVEGDIIGSGNTVYLAGAGDGEVSGNINPAWALQKNDAGTWTLSASNNYSNGTFVNGGSLVVTGGGSLGNGDVTVTGSANLTLDNAAGAIADTKNLTIGDSASVTAEAGVSETVYELTIGAQRMWTGVWGRVGGSAPNQDAHLAGDGVIVVQVGALHPAMVIKFM